MVAVHGSNGEETDEGFTLIELLVVIIIIGILAAIAIPVFLNQRIKGYETANRTDLRNAAEAEETYAIDHPTYGTVAQIKAEGLSFTASPGVTLTVVTVNAATGYCLSAKHASGGATIWYDSNGGGILPKGATGCTVTTTGTAGGSVTGG